MPYNIHDTVCAISTPFGHSGIGVIRVSGRDSFLITDKIFKGSKSAQNALSHTIIFGNVADEGKIIDEALVSIFRSPNSYTGEDVVEISAHGGPVILNDIIGLCIKHGARQALPGEFTFRAFLNGKMDLIKAESVADVIQSKTNLALSKNLEQLTGKFSSKLGSWKQELLNVASRLEASLDHPEEELSLSPFENALNSLLISLSDIIETSSKFRLLNDGIKISIAGKPNTGKSSLLNALLELDKAIVTEHPGTTRDVIEGVLDIKGVPVIISDTAGLRKSTTDPIEKIGHVKTVDCLKSADLVFLIFDSSQEIDNDDVFVINSIKELKISNVIAVFNKCDLPSKSSFPDVLKHFSSLPCFRISALNKTGLKEIEEFVFSWFSSAKVPIENCFLVNSRQAAALLNVKASILSALKVFQNKEGDEIAAHHIREALNEFGKITGETVTEDILENIFSKFCIGK